MWRVRMKKVKIGERWIGDGKPIYIVAEAGINHNGDVDLAKGMINEAKTCGVDAVKFQVFKAEEFVSDPNSTHTYRSQGKLITEPQLDMFKRYEFEVDEWKEIFEYCKNKNIEFFATPQNPSDLDFILSIVDMPVIKVGSDDLTNLELLEYYAKKNKPLIISAGMAYISEIEDAVNTIRNTGNKDLIVLHCVSSYPADAEEVNLRKILTIKQAFVVVVGFSDHTIGCTAAVGAVVLGAEVIEKHFTLDKNLPGPDHWFSANPDEMRELVDEIRFIEKALGSGIIEPTPKELEMRKIARRSIVASKNIAKEDFISKDMLDFKRPGTGLAPKFVEYIIGKKVKVDIKRNEQITFDKVC
jgi:N-acetylneuraminate synthase/N,N'-diacetyllegionaminate synthase